MKSRIDLVTGRRNDDRQDCAEIRNEPEGLCRCRRDARDTLQPCVRIYSAWDPFWLLWIVILIRGGLDAMAHSVDES
jgi:hypothetical protein